MGKFPDAANRRQPLLATVPAALASMLGEVWARGRHGAEAVGRPVAKILLVEDNELNRDMLMRRLTRRGFEVVVAVDGGEGIEMAQSAAPDLILLDMSLPVVDGWEVAGRLKAQGDTRSIPIIALTAHAMAGDRQRALEAGCDDYDTKPIELDRLLGKMHVLLGGQG
jgi:two-component system cell cycle response regulator DivK